jgi:hypothetical protein
VPITRQGIVSVNRSAPNRPAGTVCTIKPGVAGKGQHCIDIGGINGWTVGCGIELNHHLIVGLDIGAAQGVVVGIDAVYLRTMAKEAIHYLRSAQRPVVDNHLVNGAIEGGLGPGLLSAWTS